jgi:hypothetical protein
MTDTQCFRAFNQQFTLDTHFSFTLVSVFTQGANLFRYCSQDCPQSVEKEFALQASHPPQVEELTGGLRGA